LINNERPSDPPEPAPDPARDGLFDALDTLRHEGFALQNRLLRAPPHACVRLKRLLRENKAAQEALRHDLSI
ncbi:MAG TPA: hypothetical protein VN626_10015, partial [Clostridia bacterium]|nr:hypothetical protein [Clostridia bacterium]